ncbi:Plant organelle RNA recognition domain containing protein [Parasponia andersonii]|uniref:Plant organelle RNA recognition domain containing protein n=1 Tax=Parasponia andersonii TaxID=3476 RepID=A0A2P5DSB0_PARAD|nr:Plant organelle RNA recognition domain containing protein [Parasponia andersonii]
MTPIRSIFISRPNPRPHSYHHRRTFIDGATVKCVRDRGLDHAVEREKNLLPMINIKNLIKSEPSKSLPISIIAENRDSLSIPTRPIEFVRKYPSIFQEFLPGGAGFQPHFRLSPEALELDVEEQLMYQSESYKQQLADRLLKLLMLCRTNKIPLTVVERLKWDLGLPQDYERSLIPEFPDYFRVGVAKDRSPGPVLELVCWISEMGASVMERKAMSGDSGYSKGMAIAFPMQFSRGFEMDKKMKKWVDDWQKLPYVSPYENAAHLPPKSDESDKWAVAVLHEFLHILVPKKTDRENVLCLGEYLGLRSRFKRAILHHPGIFYLSSKIESYTLVLKESYKRGLLVENHPLMNMRSKYIHLMNTLKEDSKYISVPGGSGNAQKQKQTTSEFEGGKDEAEDKSEDENEGELYDSSDAEEDEYDSQQAVEEDVVNNRGRTRKTNLDVKGRVRNPERRSPGNRPGKSREKLSPEVASKAGMHSRNSRGGAKMHNRSSRGRTEVHDRSSSSRERTEMYGISSRGRTEMHDISSRGRAEMHGKSSRGRTERTEMHGRSSRGRSNFSRSSGMSMPNKTPIKWRFN